MIQKLNSWTGWLKKTPENLVSSPKIITLDNLDEATAQEVFDQACRHMLSMDTVCVSPLNKTCRYRNSIGNSCVGGCFISDAQYTGRMDELGDWISLVEQYPNFPTRHKHLISTLQTQAHDFFEAYLEYKVSDETIFRDPKIRNELIGALKLIAEKYRLVYTFEEPTLDENS